MLESVFAGRRRPAYARPATAAATTSTCSSESLISQYVPRTMPPPQSPFVSISHKSARETLAKYLGSEDRILDGDSSDEGEHVRRRLPTQSPRNGPAEDQPAAAGFLATVWALGFTSGGRRKVNRPESNVSETSTLLNDTEDSTVDKGKRREGATDRRESMVSVPEEPVAVAGPSGVSGGGLSTDANTDQQPKEPLPSPDVVVEVLQEAEVTDDETRNHVGKQARPQATRRPTFLRHNSKSVPLLRARTEPTVQLTLPTLRPASSLPSLLLADREGELWSNLKDAAHALRSPGADGEDTFPIEISNEATVGEKLLPAGGHRGHSSSRPASRKSSVHGFPMDEVAMAEAEAEPGSGEQDGAKEKDTTTESVEAQEEVSRGRARGDTEEKETPRQRLRSYSRSVSLHILHPRHEVQIDEGNEDEKAPERDPPPPPQENAQSQVNGKTEDTESIAKSSAATSPAATPASSTKAPHRRKTISDRRESMRRAITDTFLNRKHSRSKSSTLLSGDADSKSESKPSLSRDAASISDIKDPQTEPERPKSFSADAEAVASSGQSTPAKTPVRRKSLMHRLSSDRLTQMLKHTQAPETPEKEQPSTESTAVNDIAAEDVKATPTKRSRRKSVAMNAEALAEMVRKATTKSPQDEKPQNEELSGETETLDSGLAHTESEKSKETARRSRRKSIINMISPENFSAIVNKGNKEAEEGKKELAVQTATPSPERGGDAKGKGRAKETPQATPAVSRKPSIISVASSFQSESQKIKKEESTTPATPAVEQEPAPVSTPEAASPQIGTPDATKPSTPAKAPQRRSTLRGFSSASTPGSRRSSFFGFKDALRYDDKGNLIDPATYENKRDDASTHTNATGQEKEAKEKAKKRYSGFWKTQSESNLVNDSETNGSPQKEKSSSGKTMQRAKTLLRRGAGREDKGKSKA